jgi:predicted dehydrogenase
MPNTRVAVVGVGYLGKFHAEKYAALPEVDLVGVVDTDPTAAAAVAQHCSTQAYPSHTDLLDKVDAVSIAVPTPAHHSVGMDFLRHNVDVLIEKPLTASLEEADELIALADQRGAVLQVGHLERFNPAVVALRDHIERPMFIESHRLSIFQPRGTDVSVVHDLMIHDIDIILNFVGSPISMIRAAGIPVIADQVDIANARLEFESGCVANVTASRISMKNQRKMRLFQRDAYISIDFAAREAMVVQPDSQIQDAIIPGMDIQQFCYTQGDALAEEIRSFVQAVRHRQVPEVTGRMGRDALKIALSIMDQITRNNRKFLKA